MAFDILSKDPQEQVAAIYTAYYGRAPDPTGLNFWVGERRDAIENEGKGEQQALIDIAESFKNVVDGNDAENTEGVVFKLFQFPNLATESTVADFVNQTFQNLFNRDAEGTADDATTGLGFWTQTILERINNGEPIGDIIVDIASGAQGDDATILENKIAAGLNYANEFLTQDGASWELDENRDSAVSVLSGIDASSGSVSDAKDAADKAAKDDAGVGGLEVSLSESQNSVDEGGTIDYTVTLNSDIAEDQTLTVSVQGDTVNGNAEKADGADFQLSDNAITFSGGSGSEVGNTKTVTLSANLDGEAESTEGIKIAFLDDNNDIVASETSLIQNVPQGRTFSLASGGESYGPNVANASNVTTPGDDVFRGPNEGDFGSGDVIDGGGGTDTVDAAASAEGNDDTLSPSLTSVEKLYLDVTDGTQDGNDTITFDGTASTGLEEVRFDNLNAGGTDTSTVATGVVQNVGTDVQVGFKGAVDETNDSGSTAQVDFSDVSGSGDSATVALYNSDLGTGGNNGLQVDGVETLTLNAEGASGSTIEELNAGATTTLKVGGGQSLTIANQLNNAASSIETIDASENGGGLTVTTGGLGTDVSFTGGAGADVIDASGNGSFVLTAAGGAGDDTLIGAGGDDSISGGEGDDVITINGGADTVNAGAGNDTVVIGANLDKEDSLNGGEGNDVVRASIGNLETLEGNSDKLGALSSFEGVAVSDDITGGGDSPLDLTEFGDAGNRLVLQAQPTGGGYTVKGLDTGATVSYANTGNFGSTITLTVPGATDAGSTDDSLNLAFQADVTDGDTVVADYGVDGINTLNVTASDSDASGSGDANDGYELNLSKESNLNLVDVAGNRAFTMDLSTAANFGQGLAGLSTVDASDATGNVTINLNDGTNFSGNQGVVLTGGEGADTFTGTNFADSITGGKGDDVITGEQGNDNLTGGDGADTFSFNSTNDFTDTITDFASGTDEVELDVAESGLFGNAAKDTSGSTSPASVMSTSNAAQTTVSVTISGTLGAFGLYNANNDSASTVSYGNFTVVKNTGGGATTSTEFLSGSIPATAVLSGFSGTSGFSSAILDANDTALATLSSVTQSRTATVTGMSTSGGDTTTATASASLTLSTGNGVSSFIALGLSTGGKLFAATITNTTTTLTSNHITNITTVATLNNVSGVVDGDIVLA